MSATRAWLGLLWLVVSVPWGAAAQETPPVFRIGDAARPERYEAQLAIDPGGADFGGRIRIDLTFNRSTPVLWLNATGLTIDAVEFEQVGRRIAARVIPGSEDFVGFRAEGEPFAAGPAVATIRYRGSFDAVGTRGLFRQKDRDDWYVISQFEAFSARRAFPCFDEPAFKTPWRITIDAPAANVVVSNTPLENRSAMPGSSWQRHVFATTQPLPSYLVAMAVGPFDVVDGGRAGKKQTPLRYLAPRGRGAEMRYAKESTPRLMELMEEYFGTPYPFDKLDSVVIPHLVTFGAMENVGMITYGARRILAKPHEESDLFKRQYVGLASHEIAHMWFGNLVTLAWWDDIWLNEAFATWMGRKVQYQFRPEWNDGVRRAISRGEAITVDRLASTRVIANPVNAKTDIAGAFDSITYDKGGEVLSMFEAAFTPEKFREGVRLFIKRHEWGTATSHDFFRALGEASGQGEAALRAFSAFIHQPGVPLIDVSLKCEGRVASVDVSQGRLRPIGSKAGDKQWATPVCLHYRASGKLATHCEEVNSASRRIVLKEAPQCPDWVVGNAGGVGHYVMRYDAALSKRLAARIADLPRHEAVALTNDTLLLWESGLIRADAALRWAQAALRHPSAAVRQTAVRLLGKQEQAALSPAQAKSRTEIFEKHIAPMAAKLGWIERAADKDEVRQLRNALMPVAAQADNGTGLRLEAREQALRWIDERASVGATVVPAVLDTTARFADAETYARLETATLAAASDNERTLLLRAMATVRDPGLRQRALTLALERFSAGDAYTFMHAALDDPFNRRAAFEFVRANFEALIAKLPQHTPAHLMTPMGRLCTAHDRDAFVAFFRERASQFLGGPLQYAQALEGIEICIARQAQDVSSDGLTTGG